MNRAQKIPREVTVQLGVGRQFMAKFRNAFRELAKAKEFDKGKDTNTKKRQKTSTPK
jgi:hypothetical protein